MQENAQCVMTVCCARLINGKICIIPYYINYNVEAYLKRQRKQTKTHTIYSMNVLM